MLKSKPIVWLIDDRDLDCFICKKIISNVLEDIVIEVLVDSKTAVKKLKQLSKTQQQLLPNYIFLDIDMPTMNGWQVLDEFKRLNIFNGRAVRIFMLSSSVYIEDVRRSLSYQLVENFISKPMTPEKVKEIFYAA